MLGFSRSIRIRYQARCPTNKNKHTNQNGGGKLKRLRHVQNIKPISSRKVKK